MDKSIHNLTRCPDVVITNDASFLSMAIKHYIFYNMNASKSDWRMNLLSNWVIICSVYGAKPLPESVLSYCQLDA